MIWLKFKFFFFQICVSSGENIRCSLLQWPTMANGNIYVLRFAFKRIVQWICARIAQICSPNWRVYLNWIELNSNSPYSNSIAGKWHRLWTDAHFDYFDYCCWICLSHRTFHSGKQIQFACKQKKKQTTHRIVINPK